MADDPGKIGPALERFLALMGAPLVSTLTELTAAWPEIVGPALAGPTRPVEVVDGVLVVACSDASWASQIGWMDAQIKERFAARFPDETLRRVQTRIDR